MNLKLFWKVYVIDLVFMGLFVFLSRWFIGKVYVIIVTMQTIGDLLTGYEGLNQDTITTEQANELDVLVNQLSGDLTSLISWLLAFIIVIGLIYLITKSMQWNLIFNSKLKDYKKYFLRFTLFSVVFSVFLIPLLYIIVIQSRKFLLEFMFGGTMDFVLLIPVIITSILFVFFVYLLFKGYFYANNLKFLESFKMIFKFKKFSLFFVLILAFIISGLTVRYGLVINTNVFMIVLIGILVSFFFTWYKFYFVEKMTDCKVNVR